MVDQQNTLSDEELRYRELRDSVSEERVRIKVNAGYYNAKTENVETAIKCLSIISGLMAPLTVLFLLLPGVSSKCRIYLAAISSAIGTLVYAITDRLKLFDRLIKYRTINALLSLMEAEIDKLWGALESRRFGTLEDGYSRFETIKTWWISVDNVGVNETGDDDRLSNLQYKIEVQLGLRPPTK